ncbi:MAG TPA: TIR domain-containing protein, partial [Draconibacterium sp.]|nr:TIR domain-containing protein [Draconibacterium sp.]
SKITIHRENDDAAIQLLHGDLTAIPPEHAVDLLVVSAFPNNYVPALNTLMAALYDKRIYVGEMAKNKEIDLRTQLGCWLSKPVSKEQQEQFNFKQILCFEPGDIVHDDKTIVGNIFRCINAFAFEMQNNNIAMPVVASGNQKVALDKILPAIVEAAIFWLENGLPLKSIKLVLYSDEQAANGLPQFKKIKLDYELSNQEKENTDYLSRSVKRGSTKGFSVSRSLERKLKSSPEDELPDDFSTREIKYSEPEKAPDLSLAKKDSYDFFISYAHTHFELINKFVMQLKEKDSKLNIFYDKDSIPPGGLWIKQISDTIRKSKKILVFLSPDYDNSPVCWDEFQCAKLLEYNLKTSVIQTIYLYKHELPLIMGIYSYLDCREGDLNKLFAAIPKLIS